MTINTILDTDILSDWNRDTVNRILSHIDMDLDYDGNTGTAPSAGQVIKGATSGAVGKVLSGDDLGGTNATGTLQLTDVLGRFEDGEHLDVLDELPFDGVGVSKVVAIGDQLDDSASGRFTVDKIELNYSKSGATLGDGTFYGTIDVAGFADDTTINVQGGSSAVALTRGADVDRSALFTTSAVNETTTNTGNPTSVSGLVNYDAGTEDIPIDAEILAGVQASETLTLTANPLNNETVVLGSTTYTFKTTLTGAANEVHIKGSAALTLIALNNAINNWGGTEGTDYGNGTVMNPDAWSYIGSATTLVATARKPNDNTITSTETIVTGGAWGGATLTGGSGNSGVAVNHGRRTSDVTATGTYRINDFSGAMADGDTISIAWVLNYDTVETGAKFKVGDKIKGATSEAEGRVLAVTPTRLILTEVRGGFEDNEQLDVKAVDGSLTNTADVNGFLGVVSACTINHPNSRPCPIVEQLETLQGGIYSNSINNVRHSRRLYNAMQDFFDEVENLGTPPPIRGDTKNAKYTLINDWVIPDLSFRFLDSGGWTDLAGENVWQNPQSLGTQNAITNTGFGNTAIQPDLYIEFDGVEVPQFWLEGNIDIILKVKTNTSIDDATATAGEGAVIATQYTVYNRFYGHTYSHFPTTPFVEPEAQVVTIALNTLADGNNTTGVYTIAYDAGAGTWNAGERIQLVGSGLPDKVGTVVSADTGATGTITYVLKGTQFEDNDIITGVYSQVSKTVDETGGFDASNDLVQGYLLDFGFAHIDAHYTGGTTSGTFQVGEGVTQTGTGAVGVFAEDDTNDIYIGELDTATNAWNNTGLITGDESGATYTPTTRTPIGTAPKDVGDESDNNYGCVIGLNKRAGTALTVQQAYEAMKLITAKESTLESGGRNNNTTVFGKFYRSVDQSDTTPSFTEVPGSPYGLKPGTVLNAAQSVFLEDMAAADIQNYTQTDEAGTVDNPPNVRGYTVTGIFSGVRFSAFRSTGTGNTAILKTEYDVGVVGSGNNQAADSTILVGANTRTVSPLADDIPTSGFISVEKTGALGEYWVFEYASRNKATNIFTLAVTADQPNGIISDITGGADLTLDQNVFVHVFTKVATSTSETQNITYDTSDIPIVLEARIKGKVPFQGTVDFIGTANTTQAAVLNDDTAVDP